MPHEANHTVSDVGSFTRASPSYRKNEIVTGVGKRKRDLSELLSALLAPGAFDAGGFGQNYFFGQQSDLQRTTRTGINEFLRQPSPETRTYDFARPILEGMLTGTGPQFERDIAAANSQGARFGSANAILRGEALRNLFNQRTQTANTLGMLSSQAGQNPFQRMLAGGAFADADMDRRIALLTGLMGLTASTSFGLPIQQQGGNGFAQFLSVLAPLLSFLPVPGAPVAGAVPPAATR